MSRRKGWQTRRACPEGVEKGVLMRGEALRYGVRMLGGGGVRVQDNNRGQGGGWRGRVNPGLGKSGSPAG